MQHKKGNILEFTEDAVGHCANCMKTMGSGVALALRNKWPRIYLADSTDKREPKDRLGKFTTCLLDNGKAVYNIYGQYDFRGRNVGKMDLSYDALRSGLAAVKDNMKLHNLTSIALPRLGAGLAGGEWSIVQGIIESVFQDSGIEVTIYTL